MIAEQIAPQIQRSARQLVSVMEIQWPWGNSGREVIAGIAGEIGIGTGIVDRVQFGNEQLAINSRRVEFSVSLSVVFAIE